jgi:hypothetical protein
VFDRVLIAGQPDIIYAAEETPAAGDAAELLGLLVVENDGTVVPLTYGVARRLSICNVHQRRLVDAWPEYRASGYLAFRSLCRDVWREVAATPAELPFFNWHELVVAGSAAH